jgi:hypothetical protein
LYNINNFVWPPVSLLADSLGEFDLSKRLAIFFGTNWVRHNAQNIDLKFTSRTSIIIIRFLLVDTIFATLRSNLQFLLVKRIFHCEWFLFIEKGDISKANHLNFHLLCIQ